MAYKVDKADLAKIYRQFQRFVEYDDLKDLRNRLMPVVAKLETKMADFTLEYDKVCLIVRRFDEVIL